MRILTISVHIGVGFDTGGKILIGEEFSRTFKRK